MFRGVGRGDVLGGRLSFVRFYESDTAASESASAESRAEDTVCFDENVVQVDQRLGAAFVIHDRAAAGFGYELSETIEVT